VTVIAFPITGKKESASTGALAYAANFGGDYTQKQRHASSAVIISSAESAPGVQNHPHQCDGKNGEKGALLQGGYQGSNADKKRDFQGECRSATSRAEALETFRVSRTTIYRD
jgi:hypothetical protein